MITPRKGVSRVKISRLADSRLVELKDVVAVEEPLEIRVEFTRNGARETSAVSVTMRTPGDDFELAAGFLYGEGLVRRRRRSLRSATVRPTSPRPTTSSSSNWDLKPTSIRLRFREIST